MTDYGKGALITNATMLPATSAFGFLAAETSNAWITAGFLLINAIWFILLVSYISRYLFNRKV